MAPSTIARLQLLVAALLFSTGGAAIKLCTLSSWQVAGFRSGVAALALLVMLPRAQRRWSWRAPLVGAAFASTMVLFALANKLTSAANAIFLQSTAPLYIVLLGPWLLGEPVRRRDLLFMATLAGGLVLFFVGSDPVFASAPDPTRGNVVAVLNGIAWALTVIGLRWMVTARGAGASTGAALVAGNAIACLICLPWALPVLHSTLTDWLLLAYLGCFQIALAYVFLTAGMRHVRALEAALLLLLEPVLNPLWAWAIHGERPGSWSLAGGAVILFATAVKTWWEVPVTGTSDQ